MEELVKRIEQAIHKALLKCPANPKRGHIQYVHFADIIYYARFPLEKELINKLLKLIRKHPKFILSSSFHPPNMSEFHHELAKHRIDVACGLSARSLKGWWKIVKWLVENNYGAVPLVGIKWLAR